MTDQTRSGNFRLPGVILFDLDGTLLDSLPGIEHAILEAFSVCGLEVGERNLRSLIGPPIRTILSRMCSPADSATEQQLDQLEHAFRRNYDDLGWRRTAHFPDVVEVLRQLSSHGKRLFIVSNKPRQVSLKILEAEGTVGLFEDIVTRDTRRPHYESKQEMIASLVESKRLQPANCLMVGDTMEDGEAAAHTGMPFCLVTYGYGDVPFESSIPDSVTD